MYAAPPGRWQASDGQWYPPTSVPSAATWVAVDEGTHCGGCRRGVHSGVRWWVPTVGVTCRACQVRAAPEAVPPDPPPAIDRSRPSRPGEVRPTDHDRAATLDATAVRRLRLTRDDACVVCAAPTPAGEWAGWEPTTRSVICEPCLDTSQAVDRGLAGASAARESWERREQLRLDALSNWSSSSVYHRSGDNTARAFDRGAQGEERIGRHLDRISTGRAIVLHDRAASRNANIDHIVVAATGVWIVDSKNYRGRVRPAKGRFLGTPSGLRVNGREQSHLPSIASWQIETVASAVDDPAVPVRLVLAFPSDVAFGWLRKQWHTDGVWVAPPGQLESILFGAGAGAVVDPGHLERLAGTIGRRLPAKR